MRFWRGLSRSDKLRVTSWGDIMTDRLDDPATLIGDTETLREHIGTVSSLAKDKVLDRLDRALALPRASELRQRGARRCQPARR
jgi:hypothetical protein